MMAAIQLGASDQRLSIWRLWGSLLAEHFMASDLKAKAQDITELPMQLHIHGEQARLNAAFADIRPRIQCDHQDLVTKVLAHKLVDGGLRRLSTRKSLEYGCQVEYLPIGRQHGAQGSQEASADIDPKLQ